MCVMWYLETWFSGGLGSDGLRAELDNKIFFQPKQSYDSIVISL